MGFFEGLTDNLVDILIYTAMGLVFLAGLMKCILPVLRSARGLNHAVRMLEKPAAKGERPVWQDSLFLGKRMQDTWKRFLRNAEQLDARGLSCDVEDYVNDDTVIYAFGHVQMAEMLPGLLTSLGILGTFIGLIRGLGGLDVSDAARTMESIPKMIGGMTFAFTTSIVGVACSILFNIINRMALGRADASMDDFYAAFRDLAMSPPLDDTVTLICQQEDQEKLLRKASGELTTRVSEGITKAVENSFVPVTQAMNRFIMGQTQTQVEGLANITQQFIAQMNRSLSGQLVNLAETLNRINQSQQITYDALDRTMTSADVIMKDMSRLQTATGEIMTRFEQYMDFMQNAQNGNEAFMTHGSQVLSGLIAASDEQRELIDKLRAQQSGMERSLRDSVSMQDEAMASLRANAQQTINASREAADAMQRSAEALSGSYGQFVENIGSGLTKSVETFDRNVGSVLNVINEKLTQIRRTAEADPGRTDWMKELSQMQMTMTAIRRAVESLESRAGGPKGE